MYDFRSVVLRAVSSDDLAFIARVRNSPEVRRHLLSPGLVSEIGQADWLRAQLGMGSHVFIIEVNEEPRRAGYCQISTLCRISGSAELGLNLAPEFFGRGHGKAAWIALVSVAFKELGLRRVWLRVLAGNERAIRLYRSLGFVEEGRLRSAAYIDGSYSDVVQMSLLSIEWDKGNSRPEQIA